MFIVSAEGSGRLDKRNWTTHSVLGVFFSKMEAMEFVKKMEEDDEDIRLLTEIEGTKVISEERV